MDVQTLDPAIREVCPIIGCAVGDPNVRSTWTYTPTETATTSQKAAADNVIATIPIDTLSVLSNVDFIARFTNAEYRAAVGAWRGTAGNAKNWDVVVFEPIIDLNRKKTKTLKDSLVADGILTQVRADEIFK